MLHAPRLALALALAASLSACRRDDAATPAAATTVRSVLTGTVTAPDSLTGRFEVLVVSGPGADPDTLGYARVGADGAFALAVVAPARGVYPLYVLRDGRPVKLDEFVAADGDTARLTARLPLGRRPLRIRSRENDAWTAFRNARAQYGLGLQSALASGEDVAAAAALAMRQSSTILWSLRETYANTVGSEVGSAESLALLDGVDDSLLVARADVIGPNEAGFASAAEVARRAEARLRGKASALALLARFQARAATDEQRARLQAAVVTAHLDSLDGPAAARAAADLRERYPASPWADWAEGARYEAEHLLPGMAAPEIDAPAFGGGRVRLDGLRGSVVVLEFFDPTDERFAQELPARAALVQRLRGARFEIVSVAVHADTLVGRAFLSQNRLSGRGVVAAGSAAPLPARYNARLLPTRFLIDGAGRIRGKYVGSAFAALVQDAVALAPLASTPAPAPPTR